MEVADTKYDVGVLVARFQIHELHEEHRALIDFVRAQHSKVLIVLGASEVRGTTNNPLDIRARIQMVQESYPDVETAYIRDAGDDKSWSKMLDRIIGDNVTPAQTVMLYGGRDSFIRHYQGRYPTTKLESTRIISGTAIRKEVGASGAKASAEWRAGAIWQAFNRYPTAFPAVDLAIFDENDRLLLVRKDGEKLLRLPGGFVDPQQDHSFEAAAMREGEEETGLTVALDTLRYVMNRKQDDWRYRRETDKVFTTLYTTRTYRGSVEPQDAEIAEARWVELTTGWSDREPYDFSDIVEDHRDLVRAAITENRRSKIGD